MKIEMLSQRYSKTFTMLGLLFLAIYLVFVILALSLNDYDIALAGLSSAIVGIVFIFMGFWNFIVEKKRNEKFERLKSEGVRYEGKVERLVPNPRYNSWGYKIGNAECSYKTTLGKTCLVNSDTILYLEDVSKDGQIADATVYVNPDNPMDYIIEINPIDYAADNFDNDYRRK